MGVIFAQLLGVYHDFYQQFYSIYYLQDWSIRITLSSSISEPL